MEELSSVNLTQGTGSEIRDFYKDKCVFITGGIGFIGKVLIDTIIRKCPGVESIYVLVREKKGKTAHERLAETLKSKIFQGLSNKDISKICSVEGNVESPGLGLNIEDSLLLKRKAQIIIHCAANVRFDEKIRTTLNTNLKGTLHFLDLCREMSQIQSIIYVSTAFSNSHRDDIEEKFYPPPIDVESALTLVDFEDDYVMRMLEPILLGKWPNTYAFSKSITENMIKLKANGLPIGIYRPSIVLGTSYQHHMPGYIDNIFGPTSLFIGIGLGAVRVLHMNYDTPANLVPADLCANGIIAASWHVGTYKYEEPKIFNFVLDDKNLVTWSGIGIDAMKVLRESPAEIQVWYPDYGSVANSFLFAYYNYILHVIPGIFLDLALYFQGKKPRLVKLYRKLEVLMVFLVRYYQTYWDFGQTNIRSLYHNMSNEEKTIFNFDMKNFDWTKNTKPMVIGIKTFIVNNPESSSKKALRNIKIFKFLHYTIKIIYFTCLFYLASKLVNYLFGNYFYEKLDFKFN